MAQKKGMDKMKKSIINSIDDIINKGKLSDELEYERTLIIERKLKILSAENEVLKEKRDILRKIIKEYEQKNWGADSLISDKKIKESDDAEYIAEQERMFVANRKKMLKKCLYEKNMTQEELSKILGHSKTYMSELMNGIYPFTLRDIVIIHRLFKLPLEVLIPTIISASDQKKLKLAIENLHKPNLRLQKENLIILKS